MKAGEITQVFLVHPGDQRFGRNAFLFRAQHDRRPMGVVGTDIGRVVADEVLETHPDIRLDVFNQVTEVDGAIGIREGRGDEQRTFHGRNFS